MAYILCDIYKNEDMEWVSETGVYNYSLVVGKSGRVVKPRSRMGRVFTTNNLKIYNTDNGKISTVSYNEFLDLFRKKEVLGGYKSSNSRLVHCISCLGYCLGDILDYGVSEPSFEGDAHDFSILDSRYLLPNNLFKKNRELMFFDLVYMRPSSYGQEGNIFIGDYIIYLYTEVPQNVRDDISVLIDNELFIFNLIGECRCHTYGYVSFKVTNLNKFYAIIAKAKLGGI